MKIIAAMLIAYLLGAIPFAYLAGRYKGINIREYGSGNMGTTNAFRVLGKKIGALVFAGDFCKGLLAAHIGYSAGGPWFAILAGILAMLGHSWNPFFGFRPTGKGVAAGVGVLMRLMPLPTVIILVVFILVTYISGYVSLGSVVASVFAVISAVLLQDVKAYMVFAIGGAALVLFRHRENLKRIKNGTEPKVGQSKKF